MDNRRQQKTPVDNHPACHVAMATSSARAPARRPPAARNARMYPMADSTFETTRETYNDLVTRINEARAAYYDP